MLFLFLSRRRRRVRARPASAGTDLRVCPACRSHFVVPVDWEAAGEAHWWIRLRCGECEQIREVTVGDDVAERFDRDLNASMAALTEALAAIEREAMEHALHTLKGALRHDLVDASDFDS
jgi:hypothetical protein